MNHRRIKLYFTIKGHICGLLAALWELYTGEEPPKKEQA